MYRDKHSEFSSLGSSSVLQVSPVWHVVYTKPRQEQIALANLQQQGFEAYLPLYKTVRKASGDAAEAVVYEPMFSRYVFFRPTSVRQSIAGVRSTRGVCTLVSFGLQPATVSPEVIGAIRACEMERDQADLSSMDALQPGCQARLRNGPLKGLVGVVQMVSARRVTLLLDLLGQQRRVEVDQPSLVPA